jgi:hypothetical protein
MLASLWRAAEANGREVSVYFALALFAVVVSALVPGHRLPLAMPPFVRRFLSRSAVVPFAVATLVAAQHAYLALLLDATYHQHPDRAFMARMPVRFISGLAANTIAERYRTEFALLVLLETGCLVALYYGLARPTRWKLAIVLAGTLLACADAVTARAATSADMYAYVGFMLLGTHAYAPQGGAFAGDFALINAWWHTPLVSAPYGPLWLAVADGAGAFGHTLFEKILVLRLLGALALLGTAGVLAALRFPPRIVALVALNPALIFEFVANVHNDLFAVLLLLLACYATRRGAVLGGIVLAAAAGLVKLPFLLFAALAFVPLSSPLRRLRAYGITLALGLSISWLAGGRAYLAALHRAADEGTGGHALTALLGASTIVKAVAVGAVALALGGGFVEGCAWTLPALSALVHPWYLCWALPYAVASERALRNVALALPLAMLVTDTALGNGFAVAVVAAAAYLWLAVALARALARSFASRDLRA